MRSNRLQQRGQGMTEYIILVALIAIVAIGAVKYFGSKTKEGFNEAAGQVGGVTQDMKDAKNGNGSQGSNLPVKINCDPGPAERPVGSAREVNPWPSSFWWPHSSFT